MKFKSDLNEIEALLLSVLKSGELHGYEIYKKIDKSCIWKSTHQQIYKSLNNLFYIGMLNRRESENGAGKEQKIYSLTDIGKEKLRQLSINIRDTTHARQNFNPIAFHMGNTNHLQQSNAKQTVKIAELESKLSEQDDDLLKIVIDRDLKIAKIEQDFIEKSLAHIANNRLN